MLTTLLQSKNSFVVDPGGQMTKIEKKNLSSRLSNINVIGINFEQEKLGNQIVLANT